jgi:hypothetical protein
MWNDHYFQHLLVYILWNFVLGIQGLFNDKTDARLWYIVIFEWLWHLNVEWLIYFDFFGSMMGFRIL